MCEQCRHNGQTLQSLLQYIVKLSRKGGVKHTRLGLHQLQCRQNSGRCAAVGATAESAVTTIAQQEADALSSDVCFLFAVIQQRTIYTVHTKNKKTTTLQTVVAKLRQGRTASALVDVTIGHKSRFNVINRNVIYVMVVVCGYHSSSWGWRYGMPST